MSAGITVALLGSNEAGRHLGKKGTESDLTLYNLVREDHAATLVEPTHFPEKFPPLLYALAMADRTLFFAAGLSREFAEMVATADQFDTPTTFVLSAGIGEEELRRALKGTSLELSPTAADDLPKLRETLEQWTVRPKLGPLRVRIDHAFPVKGVGAVALGIVREGTLRVHDRLQLYPTTHVVEVRSIQVHDREVTEAGGGSRVGVALKGTDAGELERGQTLAPEGTLEVGEQLEAAEFRLCRYYAGSLGIGSRLHVLVGLDLAPASVTTYANAVVGLHTDRGVSYRPGDPIVLADLSVPKGPRVVGRGRVRRSS